MSACFASALISCGDNKTAEKPARENPVAEVATETNSDTVSASVEAVAEKVNSAKAVAETVIADLKEGNPEILWKVLPEDYQKDVKETIATYVEASDKEIHNELFSVTNKLGDVLKEKKDFVLTSLRNTQKDAPPSDKSFDFDALEKNWGDVVGIVKSLSNSDIASLDKLKSLDVQNFLSTTGKDIMGSAINLEAILNTDAKPGESLKDLAQTVVKELDVKVDSTKLEFTNPLSEKITVVDFIKVGEKWLPKDLADQWGPKITELKEQFSSDKMTAQDKMQAKMMMSGAKDVLGKLLKTKTQEEFDGTINEAMGMVMGMMMGGMTQDQSASQLPAIEVPEVEVPEIPSVPKFGK